MQRRTRLLTLLLAPLLVSVAAPASARDLNRQPYPIGERASGMGGAFIAMTGDPVATYYNPAGLAAIRQPGVSLSASAYQYAVETYENAVQVPLGGQSSYGADMDSTTFSTFPASIVFATPLGDVDGETRHALAFSILVPDRDRLEARLNASPNDFQFQLQAVVLQDDLTYWVGPTYAVQTGKLRFGVSVFALVHQTQQQANIALKTAVIDANGQAQNIYATAVQEISAFGATAVAQAGMHYIIDDHWTFGATLRSPTFGKIYSDVDGVSFNSQFSDDNAGNPRLSDDLPGYVDRVELKSAEMQYKLPLMAGVGISYVQQGRYALALDASVHLPQSRHLLIDAEAAPARAPNGAPIQDSDRTFEPDIARESKLVWNVNAGAEAVIDTDWKIRGGVFTDRTTVDLDFYGDGGGDRLDAITSPAIDRYGVSLAMGRRSKETTTSVGVIYTLGTGKAWSLSEVFTGAPTQVDVQSHLITAVLSGSADF